MLGTPPAGGCPVGYEYSADFDDCIPKKSDVVVVRSTPIVALPKPPAPAKVKPFYDWLNFWKGIQIPTVTAPAPAGKVYNYYSAPEEKSFFATPAGMAVIAIGAAAVVIVATKKKKRA